MSDPDPQFNSVIDWIEPYCAQKLLGRFFDITETGKSIESRCKRIENKLFSFEIRSYQ